VIHCAWDGGNTYADVDSTRQVDNISWGTELVEILTTMLIKPRFIGFGSFAEYGVLKSQAYETMTDAPISLYGQTKSSFKSISKMMCEKNDIPWTWIRPCYIYGPGDVKTRFIPSMLRKLRTDETIVLDSCTSTIDYLHVDDFCNGIVYIIDNFATGIFNVCSGEEYPIRSIIQILQQVTNSSSVLTFDKSRDRKDMSTYTCGSSDRLRSLGWTPHFTIQDGIKSSV
jgi:nucleoside-diphosphate-sugar epimerase